ncbi:hypothetical protein GWI33_003808 [Rhynchophorus ferrugineus]|uniref:Uncharacterized protein n=1 Tax=Rhynchophorus ferrugineus TaxID=354439 RepID=A0A834HWA4_RHYFE|nr:hypothetical protein GWI33_003808 [Rhynchophorus ferrugineus]
MPVHARFQKTYDSRSRQVYKVQQGGLVRAAPTAKPRPQRCGDGTRTGNQCATLAGCTTNYITLPDDTSASNSPSMKLSPTTGIGGISAVGPRHGLIVIQLIKRLRSTMQFLICEWLFCCLPTVSHEHVAAQSDGTSSDI